MKNSSFLVVVTASALASACGARSSEEDLLSYHVKDGSGDSVSAGGSEGLTSDGGGLATGGWGSDRGVTGGTGGTGGTVGTGGSGGWGGNTGGTGGTGGWGATGGTGGSGGWGGNTGGIGGSGGWGSNTGGTGGWGGTGGTGTSNNVCCAVGPTPGCWSPRVQACVCGLDPFCCDEHWDELCVEEADSSCAAGCGATGGTGGWGGNTGGTGSTGGWGGNTGGTGGTGGWGATGGTGGSGGWGGNTGGTGGTGGSKPCCESHSGTGCQEPLVQDCVCTLDSYCCGQNWDGRCALEAVSYCNATCGN